MGCEFVYIWKCARLCFIAEVGHPRNLGWSVQITSALAHIHSQVRCRCTYIGGQTPLLDFKQVSPLSFVVGASSPTVVSVVLLCDTMWTM
jgi:hypothetical protein